MVLFHSNDLNQIIVDRNNLLECLTRKIGEVKLNTTTDLVKAELYNALLLSLEQVV